MSKPTLTIITTPASAPATEPPTPAFDQESGSAHPEDRSPSDPSTSQPPSPTDGSAQIGKTGRRSPSTDEVVGTPAISEEASKRLSAGEQDEAGKVKQWSSTISTSESVPAGLRLPPIPDEATLRDLAEARSRSRSGSRSPTAGPVPRFGPGKDATRSMPSLKETAHQQSRHDPAMRGRSPLAQANTSGPSASPMSPPTKAGPSGFKAFLMKAFGLGKSSSEKQKKKDRTPVASPSPSAKPRNQPSPITRAKSPVAGTPTSANPGSFVKVSGSRSPPTLATPVFASVSPSAPSPYTAGDSRKSALAPPHSPADVPLPPSPLIVQGSPALSASGFTGSQASRLEESVPSRPSVESRKTGRSEQTTVATSDAVHGTEADVDSQRRDRSVELSSSEGTRVATSDQAHTDSVADVDSDDEDAGLVMAKPKARMSPGRASIKSDSNRIMSAIEPRQAPPFGTSPINASHVRPGSRPSSKGAELHGGVTMSRSVTAEGMREAEEIMGEKQQVLQEASEKLAALAGIPRMSVDNEEEEAKDSVGSDLGFPSRTTARKVSPTLSSGIPKYGRSISAPGGERVPNGAAGSGTTKDGFIRKPSVTAGAGLTRSGSKLRTSVYGLTDILHKKETTPKQKRISASPTMHTMGTIMKEANEIMDQDERDRAESFFMS